MSTPLWTPSAERIARSRLTRFIDQINAEYDAGLATDYFALQQWSLDNPDRFWTAVWDFCDLRSSARGDSVLEHAERLPGARWFPDARLNFAENLLRFRDDRPALVSLLENGERRETSYADLYHRVAQLAASLRSRGVVAGDRVAGFLPNIEEAVIAMLAASSIGAVWSSCSPDFGLNGVMDRFGQIQPKVLFTANGYAFNPCRPKLHGVVAEWSKALPC